MQPKVTVDTREFARAMRKYRAVSSRSFADICNKKAALIAVGATRNTKRASRAKIETELGKFVTVQETTKRGTVRNKRKLALNTRKGHSAPLAELIVNSKRAREGKPGLAGQELADAVRKMIAGRIRSIGFLASGWLPAVKELLARIEDRSGIRLDRAVKWFGKAKGKATPARPGISPVATIENDIEGDARAESYITAGLQKAIDDETKSMEAYVERKLAKDAQAFR